jgi:hypothetical protein
MHDYLSGLEQRNGPDHLELVTHREADPAAARHAALRLDDPPLPALTVCLVVYERTTITSISVRQH